MYAIIPDKPGFNGVLTGTRTFCRCNMAERSWRVGLRVRLVLCLCAEERPGFSSTNGAPGGGGDVHSIQQTGISNQRL